MNPTQKQLDAIAWGEFVVTLCSRVALGVNEEHGTGAAVAVADALDPWIDRVLIDVGNICGGRV